MTTRGRPRFRLFRFNRGLSLDITALTSLSRSFSGLTGHLSLQPNAKPSPPQFCKLRPAAFPPYGAAIGHEGHAMIRAFRLNAHEHGGRIAAANQGNRMSDESIAFEAIMDAYYDMFGERRHLLGWHFRRQSRQVDAMIALAWFATRRRR